MKRLFCAVKVPLTEPLNKALQAYREALPGQDIRWVNPQNLHITLKFFGPTPNRSVPDIIHWLRQAAAGFPPFTFTLEGCGSFGSPRFPRVLWLGISNEAALSELYQQVNNILPANINNPVKEIFSPHLTIARVKNPIDTHVLNALEADLMNEQFGQLQVNEFHLIESFLKPHGPVYTEVEAFELGGEQRA